MLLELCFLLNNVSMYTYVCNMNIIYIYIYIHVIVIAYYKYIPLSCLHQMYIY